MHITTIFEIINTANMLLVNMSVFRLRSSAIVCDVRFYIDNKCLSNNDNNKYTVYLRIIAIYLITYTLIIILRILSLKNKFN